MSEEMELSISIVDSDKSPEVSLRDLDITSEASDIQEGAEVEMKDGSMKPISQLKEGDAIFVPRGFVIQRKGTYAKKAKLNIRKISTKKGRVIEEPPEKDKYEMDIEFVEVDIPIKWSRKYSDIDREYILKHGSLQPEETIQLGSKTILVPAKRTKSGKLEARSTLIKRGIEMQNMTMAEINEFIEELKFERKTTNAVLGYKDKILMIVGKIKVLKSGELDITLIPYKTGTKAKLLEKSLLKRLTPAISIKRSRKPIRYIKIAKTPKEKDVLNEELSKNHIAREQVKIHLSNLWVNKKSEEVEDVKIPPAETGNYVIYPRGYKDLDRIGTPIYDKISLNEYLEREFNKYLYDELMNTTPYNKTQKMNMCKDMNREQLAEWLLDIVQNRYVYFDGSDLYERITESKNKNVLDVALLSILEQNSNWLKFGHDDLDQNLKSEFKSRFKTPNEIAISLYGGASDLDPRVLKDREEFLQSEKKKKKVDIDQVLKNYALREQKAPKPKVDLEDISVEDSLEPGSELVEEFEDMIMEQQDKEVLSDISKQIKKAMEYYDGNDIEQYIKNIRFNMFSYKDIENVEAYLYRSLQRFNNVKIRDGKEVEEEDIVEFPGNVRPVIFKRKVYEWQEFPTEEGVSLSTIIENDVENYVASGRYHTYERFTKIYSTFEEKYTLLGSDDIIREYPDRQRLKNFVLVEEKKMINPNKNVYVYNIIGLRRQLEEQLHLNYVEKYVLKRLRKNLVGNELKHDLMNYIYDFIMEDKQKIAEFLYPDRFIPTDADEKKMINTIEQLCEIYVDLDKENYVKGIYEQRLKSKKNIEKYKKEFNKKYQIKLLSEYTKTKKAMATAKPEAIKELSEKSEKIIEIIPTNIMEEILYNTHKNEKMESYLYNAAKIIVFLEDNNITSKAQVLRERLLQSLYDDKMLGTLEWMATSSIGELLPELSLNTKLTKDEMLAQLDMIDAEIEHNMMMLVDQIISARNPTARIKPRMKAPIMSELDTIDVLNKCPSGTKISRSNLIICQRSDGDFQCFDREKIIEDLKAGRTVDNLNIEVIEKLKKRYNI